MKCQDVGFLKDKGIPCSVIIKGVSNLRRIYIMLINTIHNFSLKMSEPFFGISALQMMYDAEKLSTRYMFTQDVMCKDTDKHVHKIILNYW